MASLWNGQKLDRRAKVEGAIGWQEVVMISRHESRQNSADNNDAREESDKDEHQCSPTGQWPSREEERSTIETGSPYKMYYRHFAKGSGSSMVGGDANMEQVEEETCEWARFRRVSGRELRELLM